MSRVRGFAPWQPRSATLELLKQIEMVLDEYRDYLPLTIRQVYYRLVGAFDYPKTENSYSRLCEKLNRARRSKRIPFEAIRDDGVSRVEPTAWAGVSDFQNAVIQSVEAYRLDRQSRQGHRLWIMCEAGGMVPMLARVADPYGVPVLSSGGFDSLTSKYDLAHELVAAGAPVAEVLHIGDYDPSGEHLFSSLAEDVEAMVEALGKVVVVFSRLAVTPDQIDYLSLSTAPPKATDRRRFDDSRTVQAEAIPPDVLSEILRKAILRRQCPNLRQALLETENRQREEVREWVSV